MNNYPLKMRCCVNYNTLKLIILSIILVLGATASSQAADNVGVFDNSSGQWALGNDPSSAKVFGFGWAETKPIVGDWNGDGKDEIGIYNPSGNNFLLQNGESFDVIGLGWQGVTPIVGDWNGDKRDEVGVFDNSSGQWALGNDPSSAKVFGFGWAETKPIVGDWNGDGKDEIGIYNPSGNNFLLQNGESFDVIGLGWQGVTPIVGDWNGDKRDEVGVFDNSSGQWALGNDPSSAKVFGFGWAETKPIVGDWNGDGKDEIGIYNPSGSNFLIQNDLSYKTIGLGWQGITPVVGNWPTAPVIQEKIPTIINNNDYTYDNHVYVAGEVINYLDKNIDFVKIVATFYDQNENILGTDYTYTDIDILKPGEKSPFEVSTFPQTYVPASYKLQVTYYETDREPYNDLQVKSVRQTEKYGSYGLIGEIINNGSQTSKFIRVVATFYDSDDKIIGVANTYTSVDTLAPGSSSPFELNDYKLKTKPAKYVLQVQGKYDNLLW